MSEETTNPQGQEPQPTTSAASAETAPLDGAAAQPANAQQTQPQPQAYQQAQVPPQPPLGQQPYQPQPQYMPQQPMPQQYAMPAPLMALTGGMKFGWFVIGALMGIPGIVLAWLVNVDKYPPVKSDALKWTIIGFVVWIVLGIIISLMIGGMITALVAGAAGSYGSYSYHGSY